MQEISQAYAKNYKRWKEFLTEFSSKIESMLEEDQLSFSLKHRVKALESFNEKQNFLAKSGKETTIKDLLGLRVVVPFQEGVEQVVTSLRQHFPVEEVERKSEQLSFREFAYDSVHVEIPVTEDLGLPEGCKPVIEVQVRTILQDAWAEVEHELIYKNHFRFPNNEAIRKKLAALNANLTLSDMIFQEIRDSQKEMEKWGRGRFKALIDKAAEFQGPNLPQDLQSQIEKTEEVDGSIAESSNGNKSHENNGSNGSKAEIEKHLMSALKAHNEHDYRTAIHFYTLVLELNPELKVRSLVFSHRGMAHFMLQMESQALSDFDRSFYCDKSNYRSLNYRAMVLRRLGYVNEAIDCFTHSLEINDKQADVYVLRSQTLAEVDRKTEAHSDLGKALELDPKNEEALSLQTQLAS